MSDISFTTNFVWHPDVVGVYRPSGSTALYWAIQADREFNRTAPECLGWKISLGGIQYKVTNVERYMPANNICIGEVIGLGVSA